MASEQQSRAKQRSRSQVGAIFGSIIKWDTNAVLAVATVVIAVATVVSFGVSLLQWVEIKKAREENGITFDATKKQVRAYIVFPSIQVVNDNAFPNLPKGTLARISLSLGSRFRVLGKNSGATPAFHFYSGVFSSMLPIEKFNDRANRPRFSPRPEELMKSAKDERGGEVLGSRETDKIAAWSDHPINLQEIADFEAGRVIAYADVYAFYRDVYNAPHYIRECFKFDANTFVDSSDGTVLNYVSCGIEYDEY
jgi:hypothetical protein